MVSGPAKRRLASRPVRLSGEKLARSSRNTRTSSSQSMSSSAKVIEAELLRGFGVEHFLALGFRGFDIGRIGEKAAGEPR